MLPPCRYREQLQDLDGEPGSLRFQALLQSESHRERLRLFTGWLKREQASEHVISVPEHLACSSSQKL
jgi:hypothetical protein